MCICKHLTSCVHVTSRLYELRKLSYLCQFRSCIIPPKSSMEKCDVHVHTIGPQFMIHMHINRIEIAHQSPFSLCNLVSVRRTIRIKSNVARVFKSTCNIHIGAHVGTQRSNVCRIIWIGNYSQLLGSWSIVIKFLFCSIRKNSAIFIRQQWRTTHIKSK